MFKKWYSNIGDKIKNLAIWQFVVEAISAIITGIILLIDEGFEDAWWALFIIFGGPIVAFVLSWVLYAFGQLVEDLHAIRKQNTNTPEDEQDERGAESEPVTPKRKKNDFEDSETEEERILPQDDLAELRHLVKEMRTNDLEALLKEQKRLYSAEEIKIIKEELKYRYR